MNAVTFLLYFFEILAAASACSILFIRNVFYAALSLIICLLSIAAIYVFLGAEFLAVTQILIYAGGILVVIIFGIMLTSKISGKPLVVENSRMISGLSLGIVVAGTLIFFFSREEFPSAIHYEGVHQDNIQTIGVNMMSLFLLPFEIAGVLLLVALLGAIVVSSSAKSGNT